MYNDDLLMDAIDCIDEAYLSEYFETVRTVAAKKKNRRKRIIGGVVALAACLAVAFASMPLVTKMMGARPEVPGSGPIGDSEPQTSGEDDTGIEDETIGTPPMPFQSIDVHSLAEYNKMQDMVYCEEEQDFSQYIDNVNAIGIETPDELAEIVKIIDELPKIHILEGDISWIEYAHKVTIDTEEEVKYVYIVTKAENGDWVRVEYLLSIEPEKVADKLAMEKEAAGETCLIDTPIKSKDGKLSLHIEKRELLSVDEGTSIRWTGEVNGMFVRIHCFFKDGEKIVTSELFGNLRMSDALE